MRAVRRERSARGDGVFVAGADQRQPALLRCRATRRLAGERTTQIGGERRPLADGIDPGLLARVGKHRRDVAGSEYARIGGRSQGFVDHDKTAIGQRQSGVGKPWCGARLGHPQRLVEFDPATIRADQHAGLDADNGIAGDERDPSIGEDSLEHAGVRRGYATAIAPHG